MLRFDLEFLLKFFAPKLVRHFLQLQFFDSIFLTLSICVLINFCILALAYEFPTLKATKIFII